MKEQLKINYEALVQPDRVHGSLYTTPEVFEDEMDRIFHRGWVYVGHSGEIPEPGDYRLKRIGRMPIIMVRDQEGQVRLLLNRCRHRGATVCQGERGNTRSFRCGYHGWTYKTNGELAGVPYPDAYDESFRREELGLTPVPRMGNHRGFIFGSLSPTGISLDEHLGRAKEQLDMFMALSDEGNLDVRAGAHKYNFKGNWKLGIENAMDGYHPNVVHESFVQMLKDRIAKAGYSMFSMDSFSGNSDSITIDLGGGHVMLEYGMRMYDPLNGDPMPEVRTTTPRGEAYMAELERRMGRHRAEDVVREGGTHILVFPNLVLIGTHMRVFTPVSVDYTETCLYPTLLKWVTPEVNAVRLRAHEAFFGSASMGGPDDSEIFERVQIGLRCDLEPWLLISRGIERERHQPDGTVIGQMTYEVTQRAIWRQWKKVMTQDLGGPRLRKTAGTVAAGVGRRGWHHGRQPA